MHEDAHLEMAYEDRYVVDDNRDYEEEEYNRNLCPACDCSPCLDPDECREYLESWDCA